MAATAANTIDMETSPMIMSMWLSFFGSGWGGGGRVDGFGTTGGGNLYANLELHESSEIKKVMDIVTQNHFFSLKYKTFFKC